MNLDTVRLERQYIGVDKWFTNNCIGTFNYYTGVGKTFAAILCLKRIFTNYIEINDVTVLVPNDGLYNQWLLVLAEHLTEQELEKVTVYTASSILINEHKFSTNLLIVDELHLFLGDEFFKTINGEYIKSSKRLGLTATYEDPKGRHTLYQNIFPVVDSIGESEAIESGFVSDYLEYNLKVELTDEEKIAYEKYTTVITNNINKFGKSPIDLATKCLAGGVYKGVRYKGVGFAFAWAKKKGWRNDLDLSLQINQEINAIWHPSKIMGYASNLMTAIRKRKDLMYNSTNKAYMTLNIIERFLGEKTIVFGQKTNYADKVAYLLNQKYPNYAVVYHSNVTTEIRTNPNTGKSMKFGKTRLKREAIHNIKTGKSKVLCTASSLDTGIDINDILLGIIGSGTQNWNQQKQRGGRVKRLSDVLAKDKRKLIVNLYIADTVDATWLKKRQSKSDNTIYWINSVDEIVFNPINKKEFNIHTI